MCGMNGSPNIDDAGELLSRLVRCPSVSAGEGIALEAPFGEARLIELLRGMLDSWGAHVQVTEAAPGRPNLIARFDGADAGRSVLLEAHADTVGVEGMTVPPFEAVVRDGRLYGRGACDTKGSMAAMLLAIRSVLDGQGRPGAMVYFAATCDEERGARGARALVAGGFRPDCAIVGEPTDLTIVHACKGVAHVRIETVGLAAHGSAPDRGRNAILQMRKVLEALEGPVSASLAIRRHPVLGPPTLNVGVIAGGTESNTVPVRCRIDVDRRLLPGERMEQVAGEILSPLEAIRRSDPAFEFQSRCDLVYPPFEEDPAGELVGRLRAACQAELGRAETSAAPWASNANIFKQAGIPSVVFGPGSVRQAHTRDEFVELEQVAQAARVYAAIIAG